MKYSKLKDIVKYYEKNEEDLISRYTNALHAYAGYQTIDSEGPFTPPTYTYYSFESYIILHYSYKRYKRTLFKKGGGTFNKKDFPTINLMNYVDSITEDKINYETAYNWWLGGKKELITLNSDKLKSLLLSYKQQQTLDTFIETI